MLKILLLAVSLLTANAHAKPKEFIKGKVHYLFCGSVDAFSGTTSISYSGTIGENTYFNVSNLQFGIPYSEQAIAESVNFVPGGLVIKIKTVITANTFYLEVYDGTHRGFISRQLGSQENLKLTCTAKLEIPRD